MEFILFIIMFTGIIGVEFFAIGIALYEIWNGGKIRCGNCEKSYREKYFDIHWITIHHYNPSNLRNTQS